MGVFMTETMFFFFSFFSFFVFTFALFSFSPVALLHFFRPERTR